MLDQADLLYRMVTNARKDLLGAERRQERRQERRLCFDIRSGLTNVKRRLFVVTEDTQE